MGRPRKNIDFELVKGLAAISCTQEEIAAVLDISVRTLLRSKQFCQTYKKHYEEGKASLRRMQWTAAQGGNVTMQIWLGKQLLSQSDKTEFSGEQKVKLEHSNGHIEISPTEWAETLAILAQAGVTAINQN